MGIFSTSMIWHCLSIMIVSALPVVLETNSGESITGNFVGVGDGTIEIQVDDQVQSVDFDDLAVLTPASAPAAVGPKSPRVTLVNGSQIAAEAVSLTGDEMIIEPRRQQPLRANVKSVKAIRFRPPSAAVDPKWLGIIASESRGDTLVIRRGDDRVDPQTGIIQGITDGKVAFDLDGSKLNAPIDRLEGVVFGSTETIANPPRIQIQDIYQSSWLAVKLEPSGAGEPIVVRLGDSLSHRIPVDQIESIRWSGGTVLLAAESPAVNVVQPYIATNVDASLTESLFAAHTSDGADLIVNGGGSVQYRIEPGYRLLAGAVRRDKAVRLGSQVTVSIDLDDKRVWTETLSDGQPRGFELSVGDARRITFLVAHAGDGDLGDAVQFVRPRLLK